ncbi:MBOAT family O-acyltransferase [Methylocystis sp.]|uniref:MBOAT family O-acyltransferase n=1 Tax=Methylocystis sp. TaxID=1911079 RepID=UPI003DA4A3A3
MLFNSSTYLLLFLPFVTVLYWNLPRRPRMWLIFLSSIVFYGFWRFDFVPLVLFSALMDYVLAIYIDRAQDPRARRRLLLLSIVANLSILCFFKYLGLLAESAFSFARLFGYEPGPIELKIILPLGISFYIFQTISYTFDVYRRELPPERDLLKYMCFVTFFGHMVAGPILRARVLMPQFERRPAFDVTLVMEGLKLILAGLLLKVVLADSVAEFVDTGFAKPAIDHSFLDAWTLAFLFGFQIYFDFAGYSHMAIGSAKLLGIALPDNFNFPYMSTSPREFWQRWQISLSTWIRDYLYLPLLGSFHSSRDEAWDTMSDTDIGPSSARQRSYALFLTWVIMGLWHGANWTFALWGFYHAVLVQAQRFLGYVKGKRRGRIWLVLGFAVTLPLSMAGWIPFRCQSVGDALTMWVRMSDLPSLARLRLGLSPNTYIIAASLMVGMFATWAWVVLVANPRLVRWRVLDVISATGYYAVAIALVVLFLQVRAQFIYFQF